jgi:hypothetical protein
MLIAGIVLLALGSVFQTLGFVFRDQGRGQPARGGDKPGEPPQIATDGGGGRTGAIALIGLGFALDVAGVVLVILSAL